MSGSKHFPMRCVAAGLFLAASCAFAQQYPQYPTAPSNSDSQAAGSTGGWRRVGDQAGSYSPGQSPSDAAPGYQTGDANQGPPPPPPAGPQGGPGDAAQQNYPNQQNYPIQNQPAYGQRPAYQQSGQQPNYQLPGNLTVPAGTFITVRLNQPLSSDHNQPGDAFSASLAQPVVVNGVVVAEPGQTLSGRVVEAQKAGHVEGVARLGVQLNELTLVDGQQIPIQTSLVSRKGPTSVGQDAGTIAATTALGAAIGAAADWGRGAAIGAGAGAAAGIIGVLVTRGHPSVLHPEQLLTFRIEAPVGFSTERSPQAFRYVQPGEYDRPVYNQPAGGEYGYGERPYAVAPPPPYYGYPAYPYYGYGYPYYWGPSFSLFVGPTWWGGYRGGYRYAGPYGRGYVGGGYVRASGGSFHASVSGHSTGGGHR